ncbi:hypothetical protein CMK18_21830 [Candidatus Poribacteria bacterium]|nr:hypothetical protein [Candidatus Poribacteria bacterium]
MGLAYDLKVDLWDGFGQYLSNGMIDLAAQDPDAGPLLIQEVGDFFAGEDWMYRFCGTVANGSQFTQAIYPTGEYIIRDITFMNGFYIFVGSYKAYFRDLLGAGNNGYAWDGFIMTLRGYSYNTNATAPFKYNQTTKAYEGLYQDGFGGLGGWGFMPMRMPIDIQPGLLADAASVAADSSVGLQSVAVAKGVEGLFIGARVAEDSANIKITTVGFQLVGDPVAQGMTYTNIDYIPFMWISQLGSYIPLGTGSGANRPQPLPFQAWPYSGGNPGDYNRQNSGEPLDGDILFYNIVRWATAQLSWRATSNYTLSLGIGKAPCENTRLFNLEDWIGSSQFNTGGGADYIYDQYSKGYMANGEDYFGVSPALPTNSSTTAWGMLPRRWFDVCTYSQQDTFGPSGFEGKSPFWIAGDAYLGGDPAAATPVTTATVAASIGGVYEPNVLILDPCVLPADDKSRLGPFMIQHCAGTSFQGNASGGSTEFGFLGTLTETASFNGSYGVFAQVPYELMTYAATGVDNPSDRTPLTYLAVNGIKSSPSGTLSSAVFFCDEAPQTPNCLHMGYLAPYQNPAPDTQGMPDMNGNKWYAKAMQSRTFTVEEENRSKVLNYDSSTIAPFGGTAEPIYIRNANTGENVGMFGNYQRYGVDSDDEFSDPRQQGQNSRQGYGLLSWQSGKGPITYMFDSGRGWYKSPIYGVGDPNYANPADYSNVVLNVGLTFNNKILTNPNDTNRKAISAQWDNDRDQWLFLFTNPTTGINAVSAVSTFEGSSSRDGFLDQTPNFTKESNLVSTLETAMWHPMLMTNELDGIVFMGGDNVDNNGGTIWGYTGDGETNGRAWVYGYNEAGATTQTPIDGWGQGLPNVGTIEKKVSIIDTFILKGTTGRQAKVWVDYVLFDGADALIATKLRERGMKVTIEAVEWFKRKIINSGDLNIKQEEIEEWMRQQQDEFQMMMSDAERQGRVRKRKKQVSAYGLDALDSLNTDFEDKEVQEFMKEYLPKSRPPTPEEEMLERQRKGGYSPQTKSYFDEVFEN